MAVIRKPYVSGYFYPGDRLSLLETLKNLIPADTEKKKALMVMAPHAGYIYSGKVAGAVYASVEIPRTIVLLGPSHSPIRSRFAVADAEYWETPLGQVSIAQQLTEGLLAQTELLQKDRDAHKMEHSLEVQLPFLQYFREDLAVVPIGNTYFAPYDELVSIGKAIASAVRDYQEEVLIVASTDMSHQVSQKTAERLDHLAVDEVLKLDAKGLYDTVQQNNISMCGFQAVTAALTAAVELGAQAAELIKYETSAEVTGDTKNVVGYAGVRIT